MITLKLELVGHSRRESVSVPVDEVLLAGYTGRDRARVLEHIHELERIGVAPPPRVPMVYAVAPELLATADQIRVSTDRTSGEVEFFLVPYESDFLVGVGSDHTDREREAADVAESKRLCPKVLGREVWRLSDVADHWEHIELASWTTLRGERQPYQKGTLGDFLSVATLLDELRTAGHADLERRVIFGGTLAVPGGFVYADHFACRLYDPVLDHELTCAYAIAVASA